MFTKRIIPCLDVNNGRVVKGVNFVDLKDAGDPVTVQNIQQAVMALFQVDAHKIKIMKMK